MFPHGADTPPANMPWQYFFDNIRVELAPAGVGVTMIYPGFVATKVRQRAFGADGKPLGESPIKEKEVMAVEQCVDQIIPAMKKRRREVVMTIRGKVGLWLKLIVPGLVDSMARKAIEKRLIKCQLLANLPNKQDKLSH